MGPFVAFVVDGMRNLGNVADRDLKTRRVKRADALTHQETNAKTTAEDDTSKRERRSAVQLRVEFCALSHYQPVALQLSKAVEADFDVETQFVPSRGGVFEVFVDGRLVFSKRASDRLPDVDEIVYHVGAAGRSRDSTAREAVSRGGDSESIPRLTG